MLVTGYIDLAKREFTHPATGEKMSLIEAIKRGYIEGSNDEIRNAITSHYDKMKLANISKAIMEYSTTKVYSITPSSMCYLDAVLHSKCLSGYTALMSFFVILTYQRKLFRVILAILSCDI